MKFAGRAWNKAEVAAPVIAAFLGSVVAGSNLIDRYCSSRGNTGMTTQGEFTETVTPEDNTETVTPEEIIEMETPEENTETETLHTPKQGDDSPEQPVDSVAARVTARLSCNDLVLSYVSIDARTTADTETASGRPGHYLMAQLDASLHGQTYPVTAEGNGKGPGAEASATTMLVDNLAKTLKVTFPEC